MMYEIASGVFSWPQIGSSWEVLFAVWIPIVFSLAVLILARRVHWWERAIWALAWPVVILLQTIPLMIIHVCVNGLPPDIM